MRGGPAPLTLASLGREHLLPRKAYMTVPCWQCRSAIDSAATTCTCCGTTDPFRSSVVIRHDHLLPTNFLVVAGPSSGGKTQLLRFLRFLLPGAAYLVRYTNRQPRGDEVEGDEYRYVNDAWFERSLESGSLVVHVGRNGNRYALTVEEVERGLSHASTLLLSGNVDTALQLRAIYSNSRICFVAPSSIDELLVDIGSKSGTPEELASRRRLIEDEIKTRSSFDVLFTRESKECRRLGYHDLVAPVFGPQA